jgi:hypothetical protein
MKVAVIKAGKIEKNEIGIEQVDVNILEKLFEHTGSLFNYNNDKLDFIKIGLRDKIYIIYASEGKLNVVYPENKAEEIKVISEIMKKN